MPRYTTTFIRPTVKLAETEAGLATGTAIECQVTSFVVDANVTTTTTPGTGCSGPSDEPGAPSYSATVSWLQDWAQGDASVSQFVWEHQNDVVWVEMTPDSSDPATKITGPVKMVPGTGLFGGTFGDGSAGLSTATWPYQQTPTIAVPTTPLAAASASAE